MPAAAYVYTNFTVTLHMFQISCWVTHVLRSHFVHCEKDSQFAIIRFLQLKTDLWYETDPHKHLLCTDWVIAAEILKITLSFHGDSYQQMVKLCFQGRADCTHVIQHWAIRKHNGLEFKKDSQSVRFTGVVTTH